MIMLKVNYSILYRSNLQRWTTIWRPWKNFSRYLQSNVQQDKKLDKEKKKKEKDKKKKYEKRILS